jgi:hypothetical protein
LLPQALRNTVAVSRITVVRKERQTLFGDIFSRINRHGSSKIGKIARALTAAGSVSVNTTVTW